MTGIIATVMRQGLESVSVRLLVKVHIHRQIPVTHVCDGAVAGHGNTDVMMPVVWSATVVCRLCLHQLRNHTMLCSIHL